MDAVAAAAAAVAAGGGGDAAQSTAAVSAFNSDSDEDDGGSGVVDGEADVLAADRTTPVSNNATFAVTQQTSLEDDVATEALMPSNGDGDHSNPSPNPPRRTTLGCALQPAGQPQQQQQALLSPPQQNEGVLPSAPSTPQPSPPPLMSTPTATAAAAAAAVVVPASATTAAASVMDEDGDGEVVNPQQMISAVPIDADRYNAILLDLDADYFLPVLNFLRHGAVMIPQHLNVDGVLAMAEYLNVTGLVRLLRGPPVPRRVLLFSWGSGGNGELGTHAMRDEPTPTMAQVTPFGVRVREIALGANYSCALTDRGHIYTFGNGEWGQLGLGSGLMGGRGGVSGANNNNTNNSGGGGMGNDGSGSEVPVELLIPRRIPLFEQIPAVHVAAGYAFAMAIVEGYHVYFWGNNNHGQSGRGRNFFDPHTKKVDTPVLVETLEGKRIIQLSCGSFFALALSEDGTLYSWGLVDCVGLGTPEEVERRYHAVLGESLSNERRSVVLTPQLVTVRGRRRTAASAAPSTASATAGFAAASAAGGGGGGSAATAATTEKIVRIRAGQWHSGAINEHGELFTWGVGYQGRLGHGSKTPAYVPTLVQGALEGQHVIDVACGSFHTVALTAHGAVFCWGDNASGQCGTTANTPDAFTAPYRVVGLEYVAGGVARSIACGRQHTVVVMDGPQPWCGLPCCQVDACGRAAHSHAQVYCFGEVTRTSGGAGSNVPSTTAAAAAASGNSGQLRGASGNPHGVAMTALNASALPGTPSHSPFAPGGTSTTAFLPSPLGLGGLFGGRPTLAGTAGHHHPHYQLVSGLQHVDVRAVVSGLHHTFAYVEELMTNDAPDYGADRESNLYGGGGAGAGVGNVGGGGGARLGLGPRGPTTAAAATSMFVAGGGAAGGVSGFSGTASSHGYTPYYSAAAPPSSSSAASSAAAAAAALSAYARGPYTVHGSGLNGGAMQSMQPHFAAALPFPTASSPATYGAASAAAAAAASAPFYLRGASAGPMSFYPPDWGLGGGPLPAGRQPSPAPGVPVSGAAGTANANRRYYLPS